MLATRKYVERRIKDAIDAILEVGFSKIIEDAQAAERWVASNNDLSSQYISVLCEQMGLKVYLFIAPLTPKESKSLGKHSSFSTNNGTVIIGKKAKVEKLIKSRKPVTKSINKQSHAN